MPIPFDIVNDWITDDKINVRIRFADYTPDEVSELIVATSNNDDVNSRLTLVVSDKDTVALNAVLDTLQEMEVNPVETFPFLFLELE